MYLSRERNFKIDSSKTKDFVKNCLFTFYDLNLHYQIQVVVNKISCNGACCISSLFAYLCRRTKEFIWWGFTLDQIRIGVNENLCKRRCIDSLFAYFRDRPISDQILDE